MPNHVWPYDFVEDQTHDGRKFRMMCLIDEFIHEALAGQAKAQLHRLLETLAGVMILRGAPAYVRSITGRSSSTWPSVNGSRHSNSQTAPSSTAAPGQRLVHRGGLPPPTSCRSPGILDS